MKNKLPARAGFILFLLSAFITFVGAIIKIQNGTMANSLLIIGFVLGFVGICLFIWGIIRKPTPITTDWTSPRK